MYKILIIYFCSVMSIMAQDTYSKLYDIDLNLVSPFIDVELVGNEIWVVAYNRWGGLTYVKFDDIGIVIYRKDIDDFVPAVKNCMLVEQDSLFILGRYNETLRGDLLLNGYVIKSFDVGDDNLIINNGIVKHLGQYYTYGLYRDTSNVYPALIVKWDSSFVEIKEVFKPVHDLINDCDDLMSTPMGDLVYVNSDFPVGVSDDNAYIIKMDVEGNELSRFSLDDRIESILAARNGDIIFDYDDNLNEIFPYARGAINRLSPDMDSIIWSVNLPFNGLIDGRKYYTSGFKEAENGDILVCGWVIEYDVINLNSTVFDGSFLARLTKDGEIVWTRAYRFPNRLITNNSSKYKKSYLRRISETENGNIITSGILRSFYLNEDGSEDYKNLLWILNVDGNGCLAEEECQNIITIDTMISNDQQPIFKIGAKWTYDYLPKSDDLNVQEHNYISYEIVDTLQYGDKLAYRIECNRTEDLLMYQDDKSIYFWDTGLDDWQLSYDFDAVYSYETSWVDPDGDLIKPLKITIDTLIFSYYMLGWGMIVEQHISIPDNGTIDSSHLGIHDRIGRGSGGLRLGIGKDEKDNLIGDIRCFEQGDFDWNFGPLWPIHPCDTIYTEILDATKWTEFLEKINVYPNLTKDYLNISGVIQGTFTIIDIKGKLVMKNTISSKINVSKLPSGQYYLKIFSSNGKYIHVSQFIKL